MVPVDRITDLSFEEVTMWLESEGIEQYRAQQLFEWIYKKRVSKFEEMTNVSKSLRTALAKEFVVRGSECVEVRDSASTDTTKYLFRLHDGETIETVLMRDRNRHTICISTQVGCPLACAFCATGQSGFVRDLATGEIVEQVLAVMDMEGMEDRSPNVVYMGMGEPMLNYDSTAKSIRILMDSRGVGIGARRITVSTAGVLSGISRFSKEEWQVRLSISLHSVDDRVRGRIMPVARQCTVDELMDAVRVYSEVSGRQVTFEYVLIAGVNDSPKHAEALAERVRDIPCSVNLIMCNRSEDNEFGPPQKQGAHLFRRILTKSGVRATLRKPRGRDVEAACGQLRRRKLA